MGETLHGGARHTVRVLLPGEAGTDAGVGGGRVIDCAHGENLLGAMRRAGLGALVSAPCGGGGRCGKCLVNLNNGGSRLACRVEVTQDLVVTPAGAGGGGAKILTAGIMPKIKLKPYAQKLCVALPPASLNDQAPDDERLLRALAVKLTARGVKTDARAGAGNGMGSGAEPRPNAGLAARELRSLSEAAGAGSVTCVLAGGRVTGLEAGDTERRCLGAAFDIGTTTIATYLYDLGDGTLAAAGSALNPQAEFGADVVTRINYTTAHSGGAERMRARVLSALNGLLSRLSAQAGVTAADVYAAFVTGNTTMLHFFIGLPARNIAVSPFAPLTTGLCAIPAAESGLDIAEAGVAVCLPGVSGYVGADTLCAALACGMDRKAGVSMLIDIGTNGELLLGTKERMFACSTAAGPAFEGASIRNGVGGVEGAIDAVEIDGDVGPRCTTIGGAAPAGLCGSGLVDAVARLLPCGVIDETGALANEREAAGLPEALRARLTTVDGDMRAFSLFGEGESGCLAPGGIAITQRDVRELQNAKAAIAAGIRTLLGAAGVSPDGVSRVYLAGGFGNYIRVDSALAIGLVPREFRGRIVAAGNAAGTGAAAALLSTDALRRLSRLRSKVEYIELSASAAFTEAYIDCMGFDDYTHE